MDKPDYEKHPCCGYEHHWSPGAGKWFSTGPNTHCSASSLEQIEDVAALLSGRKRLPAERIDLRALLTMPYETYAERKRSGTLFGAQRQWRP